VRLDHAIKHAQTMIPELKGKDAVAVHVLVELAKRARRAQKPIRQLADALSPKEPELNQVSLFTDPEVAEVD
jgi:hypothetical protein